MNFHKTHLDPMRWKVAALVALALFGIGAMHTHVLMFRSGEDVLSALIEVGGMILIAAIPIGYLVYRFWFAKRELGANTGEVVDSKEGEFAQHVLIDEDDNLLSGYDFMFGYGYGYTMNLSSDDE